jgi:3-deoxy-D-manno-octulosonic-acid transferase
LIHVIARAAYSTLLWLATPLYFARLWWRGRREPAYRQQGGQRLGFGGADDTPGRLWVHAVSLGETLAAGALVQAIREHRPGIKLLLTHSTATGRAAGQALLRDGDVQVWLPYDTPGATRRFLHRHLPHMGVLMETELWPNLLHAAAQAEVPMVLANARLSARSQAKGQRLRVLMQPAVASLRLVLAQTEADALRLRASGAPHVEVMGNLKFDITPTANVLARGQVWRRHLGRAVVLAAVTREGEEQALLQAWTKQPAPRPLLLIVPRHPQRFDEVAGLVKSAGLTLIRRSSWADMPPLADLAAADVCLGDSMQEMPLYYGLADIALLGGSFAPLGGQNLIEAAACGCPLLMGPHTFNFAQAAEMALEAGAAERVADLPAAVARALQLVGNTKLPQLPQLPPWRAKALQFANHHRGAAQRMAAAVLKVLQTR